MSDYKFMLESHLTAEQSRALAVVDRQAADAGLSLFLTGGAMRDMLGGFPIRDLDFTLEGNPIKICPRHRKGQGRQNHLRGRESEICGTAVRSPASLLPSECPASKNMAKPLLSLPR